LVSSTEEAVVARAADGGRVASLPLSESGEFGIAYRHSYYEAPAIEHFVVDGQGFRMTAISSPHEGVLDYYRLEGEREKREGRVWLNPDEERVYDSLPLIATERGRRTLVASSGEKALYTGKGARHLTISIEGNLVNRALPRISGSLSRVLEPDAKG
jgi:hypothetical protein